MDNNENSNQENLSQEERMNRFFEEMQQKISKEEQKRTQKLEDTLETLKDKIDDINREEPETPKEEVVKKSPSEMMSDYLEDFRGGLGELKEEMSPAVDAAKEIAQDAFDKGKDTAKKLWGQFDTYTDSLEKTLKAKEDAYQEKKKSRPLFHDTGDSLFKGTGGLFDKAKKFSEKYAEKEEIKPEGEITILPVNITPKKKIADPNETVYGFEDLDGDGDSIIDDAILDLK